MSSLREGAVYEVGLDGALRMLVRDDRLTSILESPSIVVRTGRSLPTQTGAEQRLLAEEHGQLAERRAGRVDRSRKRLPDDLLRAERKVYVLSSHLDEWIGAKESARDEITKQARRAGIRQIGVVAR